MPESNDTRIARLEAARDSHKDQLRALGPLVSQYAVLEERLRNFGDDLNKGFDAIRDELTEIRREAREEIAEIKKDQAERAKERRTMLIALFVAGIGLFGTFVATAVPLLKNDPVPVTREKTR